MSTVLACCVVVASLYSPPPSKKKKEPKQEWTVLQGKDESFSLFASRSSGAIEHRDRPNTPAKFFTQADVNGGKLVYRPPQAPTHLQELYQYSFMGESAAAPPPVHSVNCRTSATFLFSPPSANQTAADQSSAAVIIPVAFLL